jgi:hypothetical protein
MPIFDIRGTHGSGKSWIVWQLLSRPGVIPIAEGTTHLGYYVPDLKMAVVGKYASPCGGCDQVGSADEIVRRIKLFASKYKRVVLEGILVSHTFSRYSRLALELGNDDYHFLFLDTPLASCIARVRSRRKERGDKRPFNPHNVIHDHKQIWTNTRKRCIVAGHSVIEIDWLDPLPQVLNLISNTSYKRAF